MRVSNGELHQKLVQWYRSGKQKDLNLIALPYSSLEPLAGLFQVLAKGDRILWVKGSSKEPSPASAPWKNLDFSLARQEDPRASLVLLEAPEALLARDEYDLVIFDDLSGFPEYPLSLKEEVLLHALRLGRRRLSLSVDKVFSSAMTLEGLVEKKHHYISEPRILLSRVDPKEEVCNSLFDFLNYFLNDQRLVVLFAPEETLASLRDYLLRIDPSLAKDLAAPPEKKGKHSLAGEGLGRALMLCPTIQDFVELPQNIEFIVADAPGAGVDYRGFIFLCVRAGRQPDINGEVLLFGKEATQDMLRAKEIARQFNQALWESEELR